MRILYGVQATGNGHINRAKVLYRELKRQSITVDFLFSGNKHIEIPDEFKSEDVYVKGGLTYTTINGSIDMLDTILKLKPVQFIKDIVNLHINKYDLIISDYEPITAWASILRNKDSIGLGNQYIYSVNRNYKTNIILKLINSIFAPLTKNIYPLGWNNHNNTVLPPLLNLDNIHFKDTIKNKILVYLPYEHQQSLLDMFKEFINYDFYIYTNEKELVEYENTFIFLISNRYKNDMMDCNGIMCNGGFETISEALYLGKKILIKPIFGQIEQENNAKIVVSLSVKNSNMYVEQLTLDNITQWLNNNEYTRIDFKKPVVKLVDKIISGNLKLTHNDISSMW